MKSLEVFLEQVALCSLIYSSWARLDYFLYEDLAAGSLFLFCFAIRVVLLASLAFVAALLP